MSAPKPRGNATTLEFKSKLRAAQKTWAETAEWDWIQPGSWSKTLGVQSIAEPRWNRVLSSSDLYQTPAPPFLLPDKDGTGRVKHARTAGERTSILFNIEVKVGKCCGEGSRINGSEQLPKSVRRLRSWSHYWHRSEKKWTQDGNYSFFRMRRIFISKRNSAFNPF